MKRLASKVAVVTGGAAEIGFATAKKFLVEGSAVAILGRKRENLDKAVAQLREGCSAFQGDVTNQVPFLVGEIPRIALGLPLDRGHAASRLSCPHA